MTLTEQISNLQREAEAHEREKNRVASLLRIRKLAIESAKDQRLESMDVELHDKDCELEQTTKELRKLRRECDLVKEQLEELEKAWADERAERAKADEERRQRTAEADRAAYQHRLDESRRKYAHQLKDKVGELQQNHQQELDALRGEVQAMKAQLDTAAALGQNSRSVQEEKTRQTNELQSIKDQTSRQTDELQARERSLPRSCANAPSWQQRKLSGFGRYRAKGPSWQSFSVKTLK